VFAEDMIGNALIYTTGKSSELPESMWPYSLSAKRLSGVSRETDSNWTVHSVSESDGTITVNCSQNLADTEFSRATESVTIRAAWGGSGSLSLSQHGYGEYSSALEFDLLTGAIEVIEDDYTLEDVHGVLMWIAWALLAPIGIMASTFRFLFPVKPKGRWFMVHRGVQVLVVLLTLIAFVIAIVFTENKGTEHFSNNHMALGLVVTIFAVLQPVNAFFRPHPPQSNLDEVKTVSRMVWEYLHKGAGYGCWVAGCVAAYLGLRLRGEETLASVHLFGWCLMLLLVYLVLSFLKWRRMKQILDDEEKVTSRDPMTAGNEDDL